MATEPSPPQLSLTPELGRTEPSPPQLSLTPELGRTELDSKLRDECLNMEWFTNRREAKVLIDLWRREYNDVRPHSSIGYLTPTAFRRQITSNPNNTSEEATLH